MQLALVLFGGYLCNCIWIVTLCPAARINDSYFGDCHRKEERKVMQGTQDYRKFWRRLFRRPTPERLRPPSAKRGLDLSDFPGGETLIPYSPSTLGPSSVIFFAPPLRSYGHREAAYQ